jgi:diguanylate cyclase (GGDEF)-like protein
MKRNHTVKTRHPHFKLILCLIAITVFAMVIEVLILHTSNKRSANRISQVLLNQVVSILEDNDQTEKELIEALKEDYIIRAQTVSYILDAKPEAERDVEELQKIAGMMDIDEIHLFDENGIIYSGTEPKYYGYSFDSGEQMAYFKPMLDDRELTLCQDVTPNTAEGKSMMYAITWSESKDKMVQVGIKPVRLLEELRSNEIPDVIANMPAYEGFDILVADAVTGDICAATNDGLKDRTLEEVGVSDTDFEPYTTVRDVLWIDGYRNYCSLQKTQDYIVMVAYSTRTSIVNFLTALGVELLYLMLADVIVFYMVNKVGSATDEKNAQIKILTSMSDIYNTMHLIDLEKNILTEYSARDEITEVVKHNEGADRIMKELMELTTEENYLDAAQEFTDLRTVAGRMQNKKIISKEFMSKAIGWYRGSFITINKDEAGYPTKLIYVTQNIDKEKKKEEELLIKSNIDQLTGLYNRRAYEDDIADCHDTVTEQDFVFVSMDLNGLKTVNDTLGHAAGDELIIGAADCMEQCFGSYGRIYRIGGDEFAAILFVNEIQLHNIKQDFEDITARWSGKLVEKLSVSCGFVAKSEEDITSVREMANMADKRMYEAKAAYYGRNVE